MIDNEDTRQLEAKISRAGKLRDAQPPDSPARGEFDDEITALTDQLRAWKANEGRILGVEAAIRAAMDKVKTTGQESRRADARSINARQPWLQAGTLLGIAFVVSLGLLLIGVSGAPLTVVLVMTGVGFLASVVFGVRSARDAAADGDQARSAHIAAEQELGALRLAHLELLTALREGRVPPPEYGSSGAWPPAAGAGGGFGSPGTEQPGGEYVGGDYVDGECAGGDGGEGGTGVPLPRADGQALELGPAREGGAFEAFPR